jgi:NAD kinase
MKLIIIALFFISCSEISEVNQSSDPINLQESSSVEVVITDKGEISSLVKSDVLINNDKERFMRLRGNIEISLFDSNVLSSITSCDSALVDQEKNIIKAFGNIQVRGSKEKFLFCQTMEWNNFSNKIISDSDVIFITSKDTLYGNYFESDIDLSNWVLKNPKGVISND